MEIKRYSNRKLYDTEAKRYITLDELAEAVRRGEVVRVTDHDSGADLTSVTLLQIIFAEEKKIGGLLPQIFLTRLIRTGGDTVNALRSRLAPLDPFPNVDEEIHQRLQKLAEQGRITSEEAAHWFTLLRRPTPPGAVDVPVQAEAAQKPTTEPATAEPTASPVDAAEMEALLQQVEALEAELQRLQAPTS